MTENWEDYFDPGEKFVWQGAPVRRGKLTIGMVGIAVFGVPFLLVGLATSGGAVLYLLGVDLGWANTAGSLFMFFFGLPFLGFGVGMVFGPYYAVTRAHQKVRYALSDRRAYIASQWWNRKMEVLVIAPDAPISIEGDHSVYFYTRLGTDSDGDRTTERKGFEFIEDARTVYRLIRETQARVAKGDA